MKTFFHSTITVLVLIMGLVIVAGCSVNSPVSSSTPSSVTLGWEPNTEENLGGYTLHYGVEPGNYAETIDIGNKTSYTMTNLQSGNVYYFALSAYSVDGLSSGLSEEVEYAPVAY